MIVICSMGNDSRCIQVCISMLSTKRCFLFLSLLVHQLANIGPSRSGGEVNSGCPTQSIDVVDLATQPDYARGLIARETWLILHLTHLPRAARLRVIMMADLRVLLHITNPRFKEVLVHL
jgi:hypothetical protein